ncbi:MAG: hypothetical protein ACTSRG_19895 [Candidatus Helarchaeota archaeon]
MLVKDVAIPREEVLKGEILGIINLYNVNRTDTFENSPKKVFENTFPSIILRNILQSISQKIQGKGTFGTYILSGGYGTGKSHLLLNLFHIFKNPEIGENWLKNNEIEFNPLKDAKIIAIHLLNKNVDYLWTPIFEELGAEDLLSQIKDFPDGELLEKILLNQNLVIIYDELESWYEGKEDKIQERNLNFLQVLTEISNKKNANIFVFMALYGKNPEIWGRIQRINPYIENLTVATDKVKIVLFRLFKSINQELAKQIIEKYIQLYRNVELELEDFDDLERKMLKCYPLHPELVDVLFDRFGTSRNYSNTRGVLFLLSSMVQREYDKIDLLLISNIKEEEDKDLLIINRDLVEKTQLNIQQCVSIKFGNILLKTILLYSLGELRNLGATSEEIMQGILRPGMNINEISSSLSELPGNANNLWHINERYLIRLDENIVTIINTKAKKNIREGNVTRALNYISETIKKVSRVKNTFTHPLDEIVDDKKIAYVISLKTMTEQEIEKLYRGKQYRNTIVLIQPKGNIDIQKETDLLINAERILIAEEMLKIVEKEKQENIRELIKRNKDNIDSALTSKYGNWVKNIFDSSVKGKIRHRLVGCELDIDSIKNKLKDYDQDAFKQEIIEELKERKEKGLEYGALKENLYSLLGKPILSDEKILETAIKSLIKDEKMIIEKGRTIFPNESRKYPERLEHSMVLKSKRYAPPPPDVLPPESPIIPPQPPSPNHPINTPPISEPPITPTVKPPITPQSQTKKSPISHHQPPPISSPPSSFNVEAIDLDDIKTPWALIEQVERKLELTAKIQSTEITVNINEILTRDELISIIEKLPTKSQEKLKVSMKIIKE